MSEINESGYQDLRDFIENNWIYHSIEDENENELTRRSIADEETNWTHNSGDRVLEISTKIYGNDFETLPVTLAGSAVYDVGSDGAPKADKTFNEYTLEQSSDEVIIRHQIPVPMEGE